MVRFEIWSRSLKSGEVIIFIIIFYRISLKIGKESIFERLKDNIVMRVILAKK